METLKSNLQKRLEGAKRIALLAVGSSLRGDDAAGLLLAEKLRKTSLRKKNFKVFVGETAPENMTGEVRRFKPTHVIIADCADLGAKPGTAALVDTKKTGISGVTFSTHQLPMNILSSYLAQELSCEVILLGIQPRSLKFGGKPSKEIKASVNRISSLLMKLLSQTQKFH